MTEALAAAVLAECGGGGPLRRLASGMSSEAWVGSIDGVDHVIRVPVGDGRRPLPAYAREARLLADLATRGAPVAEPTIVVVDGCECSVARRVEGHPVAAGDWSPHLVDDLARAFAVLHSTASDMAVESSIEQRFHLASIWPFDGSLLTDHPASDIWPRAVDAIEPLRDELVAVAEGEATVVHSDLHPQHLLVGHDGRLAGVLDFGDAFAGVAAWDHACLRYSHGRDVERRVSAALGSLAPSRRDVDLLSVAWGLYKIAKTPDRTDVLHRVEELLRAATTLDISPG